MKWILMTHKKIIILCSLYQKYEFYLEILDEFYLEILDINKNPKYEKTLIFKNLALHLKV